METNVQGSPVASPLGKQLVLLFRKARQQQLDGSLKFVPRDEARMRLRASIEETEGAIRAMELPVGEQTHKGFKLEL